MADIAERLAADRPGRARAAGRLRGVVRATCSSGARRQRRVRRQDDVELLRRLPRPHRASCRASGTATFTEALDEVFPNLRIIFVRRRDKVAQAVSLWKAIQTQQWRNEADERDATARGRVRLRALEHLVDELHRWDARWEDWFHATGREPIRVIYEEFVDARAATVGRVLDALGIDPPEPDGRGPMKRQADDLSHDWVARFRDDDAEHSRTSDWLDGSCKGSRPLEPLIYWPDAMCVSRRGSRARPAPTLRCWQSQRLDVDAFVVDRGSTTSTSLWSAWIALRTPKPNVGMSQCPEVAAVGRHR